MKYKNIFITGSTGVVGKPVLRKIVDRVGTYLATPT